MTSLRLDPVRALTYAPDHNLADVTCPPYDTITQAAVRDYEAAHPHNIVRLILPRPGTSADRYAVAADELNNWLDTGVLVEDDDPALFVYAQETAQGSAIGLIGGIGLDGPILPHENTFPGPVADRVALMSSTRAQLEPILLTYQGGGATSEIVDAVAGTRPDIDAETGRHGRQRLWRISDPSHIQAIHTDLSTRQALIADGHHRFAAYRELSAQRHPGADGLGLAMLVDATRHPLELRAMHRSVASLPLTTAMSFARTGFDVAELDGDPLVALGATGDGPAFVVGDGERWMLLTSPDHELVESALPAQHSARWRSLDAAVLRHVLLARLWDVDDASQRVGYHSAPDAAVDQARNGDGVAVYVRPPRPADVLELAANDERMPQKSTSFGPKPLTGLLMRRVSTSRLILEF